MTRTTWAALCAAVISTPVIAACGSSTPDASKFLDNEKIERAIEQSVAAQRHSLAFVRCPSLELIKKSSQFTCSAQVYQRRIGAPVTFRVTQTDGSGHVQYVGLGNPPANGGTASRAR